MREFLLILIALFIIGCSERSYNASYYKSSYSKKPPTQRPYVINGKVYYPKKVPLGWTER